MKTHRIATLLLIALLGCQPVAPVEAQKAASTEVQKAALSAKPQTVDRTVYVEWNPDCTRKIQEALDLAKVTSGKLTVVFRFTGKPYVTRKLVVHSNTTILFHPLVELVAQRGSYPGVNAAMFTLRVVHDVTIIGHGALLRGWGREQQDTCRFLHWQWRHCFDIKASKRITLVGITIQNWGGSGISIGPIPGGQTPCRNITIEDVTCVDNIREGLFVTSVITLRVRRCEFNNTAGHNTQAGIDLEPNKAWDYLSDILIENCVADNNNGPGYDVWLQQHNESSPPVDIGFNNCWATGNQKATPTVRADNGLGAGSYVRFDDCTFLDQFGKPADTLADYENCVWGRDVVEVTR